MSVNETFLRYINDSNYILDLMTEHLIKYQHQVILINHYTLFEDLTTITIIIIEREREKKKFLLRQTS